MSIQITVNVERLRRIQGQLRQRTDGLLDKVARDIERDAKQSAPVQTGALRNSIHVEDGQLTRTIADAVEYGVFQEFGTVRNAARPFLKPAVERQRKPFLEAWRQLFG